MLPCQFARAKQVRWQATVCDWCTLHVVLTPGIQGRFRPSYSVSSGLCRSAEPALACASVQGSTLPEPAPEPEPALNSQENQYLTVLPIAPDGR